MIFSHGANYPSVLRLQRSYCFLTEALLIIQVALYFQLLSYLKIKIDQYYPIPAIKHFTVHNIGCSAQ